MKSRCLLNSCIRCSLLFFSFFFFLPNKELPFYSTGEPLHDHGLYLHDPPPFNVPFFMTPPFSESQKVVTLPLFPPPSPPANF